jgi:putative phosphoribosyl transferase
MSTRPELPFRDRRHAGQVLCEHLRRYAGLDGVLVLALPRGGVPVGFEVAHSLGAELDVLVVRKLGMPGHPEYAIGALASGGVRAMNEDAPDIGAPALAAIVEREVAELTRRERTYRGEAAPLSVEGRTVILVDDGLATGATMRAAARAVRAQNPRRVVVAAPVGARDTCESLRADADEVVCAAMPEPFRAVGLWYRDFEQVDDEGVRALLAAARPSRNLASD